MLMEASHPPKFSAERAKVSLPFSFSTLSDGDENKLAPIFVFRVSRVQR